MKTLHPRFLDRTQSALVVVDIQGKLFPAMFDEGQTHLKRYVPVLLQAARLLDIPALVTEQYPRGLGPTLPDIATAAQGVPVLEKIHFAATEEETFLSVLGSLSRRHIVLCGMETHICVYQTALGLLQLGYEVHAVSDALASRTLANHATGLRLMEQAGASITSTEAVLFQWLEKAGSDAFKTIQKMII